MKNQYFGDRRDLFKYDLLLDLVKGHGSGRLTFVPMLTPNDDSGEGQLTQADSRGRRKVLYDFLKACLDNGQRDIRKLRELIPKFDVEFMPFRDAAWFTHEHRTSYFEAVPQDHLQQSVIFLDPDIGLETGTPGYMRRMGAEKYLLYADVTELWRRASTESVLVVYQHLQKDAGKRAGDVERRIVDLGKILGTTVRAVQWNDLAFLVVTPPEGDIGCEVRTVMSRHAQEHSLAFREVVA